MFSYRYCALCFLSTLVLGAAAGNLAQAQGVVVPGESVREWTEYIKWSDNSGNPKYYEVSVCKQPVFGTTPDLGVLFKDDKNCGNPAHRTKRAAGKQIKPNDTSRWFKHYHLNYAYPIGGRAVKDMETGLILSPQIAVTVTQANVEAFWHHYYTKIYQNRWTYHGGINPLVNCWGYAFGYSMWVENSTRVYNNDYVEISLFGVEPGHLIPRIGHVIVVTGVDDYPMSGPMWAPNMKMVTKTLERNRSSGVYEVEWTYLNQIASSFWKKYN